MSGVRGLGKVPLTYVGGAVARSVEDRADSGDARVELGVLWLDDVVDHTVAGR
jgi:hypothetical protein